MNMRKRTIVLSTVVLALLSFSSVQAQMRDTAAMRQRQEQMLQKMKTDLKLTDVQGDSLKAIQAEFQPKMREIFMDQSASQDDKRAQISTLMDARNARVKAVLGPDLFAKYQDWMTQNRPMRGGGGGGNR
jgi:cytochrome c-type biogenesis protein CcmH/NrfF